MIFTETRLAGAFIVDVQKREDARGFFAREFCDDEFRAHGLEPVAPQTNMSLSHKAGTIRGMHFQYPPAVESKVVRCVRGALVDIIVDLRPESPTFLEHVAVELTEDNWRSLYVPGRFAHGFQTLRDDTVCIYRAGHRYAPDCEAGLRYNDPRLGLTWPVPVSTVSDKDTAFADFDCVEHDLRQRMMLGTPQAAAPHQSRERALP